MRRRPQIIVTLFLLPSLATIAMAQQNTVPARPRLLSAKAREKAEQTGSVTEPVKRRPAGTFEFPVAQAEPPVTNTPPATTVSQLPPADSGPPSNEENLQQSDNGVTFVARSDESGSTVSTVQREQPQLVPGPTRPLVDDQGRLHGASVADRMGGLRRRAVDADLGQSFVAAEPEPPMEVEQYRALPTTPANSEPNMLRNAQTPHESHPVTETGQDVSDWPTPATSRPPVCTDRQKSLRTHSYADPPSEDDAAEYRQPRSGDLLFQNAAPAISFQTVGPRKVVIGRESLYRVMLSNSGTQSAENVIVTVKLPPWAEVVSTGASAGATQVEALPGQDTIVDWRIPQLAARAQEFISLNIVPRDGRPFDLAVGWALAPSSTMMQIDVEEPKLEMSISGPNEVMYGSAEVFTITLSNPGTGDAENVVLNLLPVTSQQHMAGTREMGTIRAGERKSVDIELTAHQGGQLMIKASAFADSGLRTEAVQEVMVRRANLEVTVQGPPQNFAATESVYRVRVENIGDAVADDTRILVALPRGANLVNCSDGGKLNPQHGHIQWQIGSLRPGAARTVDIVAELHQTGDNRFDVQCQAQRDLSTGRSFITRVEALADLKLTVNDPKGAVPVGADALYEVKIVNRGTKAAQMITIMGFFSDGIEPVAVRGWRGSLGTGQVTMEPIPAINPGQEVRFEITARAHQPGDHVFRAELTCNSPETRLASEEWTKYFLAVSDNPHEQIARQPEPQSKSETPTLQLQPLR